MRRSAAPYLGLLFCAMLTAHSRTTSRMKKALPWVLAGLFVALYGLNIHLNEARDLDVALRSLQFQKTSEARIAAKVIEVELRRFTDIVAALAAKDDVGAKIAAGDWEGAIDLVRRGTVGLADIDRATLLDMKGILRSDFPVTQSIRGKDFSFRDWYVGVTTTREAYASEVYKRAGLPRINVLSVAAIVKDPATTESVAILMLQIPASKVYGWSDGYDFGQGASVTFVDRNGNLVQESYEDTSEIVKVLDDPIVQKAMRQQVGADVITGADGQKDIAAYAPVSGYGWSVVTRQPLDVALASELQDQRSRWIYAGGFLAAYAMLLLVWAFVAKPRKPAVPAEPAK